MIQRLPSAGTRLAIRAAMFALLAGYCVGAAAQQAASLADVKTLFVATFGGAEDGALLHDSLIHRLAKSDRFRIVQSAKEADAIVNGTGEIWIRGFTSTNVRTPSAHRQSVYNGYLSLEVINREGQPLWSWLVTPGNLVWNNIVDDLAGRAVKKLVEASASGSAQPSAPTVSSRLEQTSLSGAGATFPAPLYLKWFEDFEALHTGVHIRYSPIGSQLGDEQLADGQRDFAGSDVAPEVAIGPVRAGGMRQFAAVLGAVVPIYNLNGVTRDLHLTPETLADIYLGRVRRWNDPAIRRSNKDVDLPDVDIAVVHRSDGSGTTWVWSDFLSKVSPDWLSRVGRGTTLHWPVGLGAEYNQGVTEAVQKTPNSIGYVELAYAIQHDLSFAGVRNRAGEFVHADLESLAEAAKETGAGNQPPTSITDAPGKYAYPIAAFTWIILPAKTQDPAKSAALIELLRWVLTSGQKECSALGYVPLPRELAASQLRSLNSLP
ncbi:MAG: phosphate ABC transporter substrate-binding protein PstS [Terracidiphilus sp.]